MPKKGKGNSGGQGTKPKANPSKPKANPNQGGKGGKGAKGQPNYSESTKKAVNQFLHERGAARREKRAREEMREQGAVLFASIATAQANQMVASGLISKREKKEVIAKLEKEQTEHMEKKLSQRKKKAKAKARKDLKKQLKRGKKKKHKKKHRK
eukprot:SAG11_NODE_13172_length_666_cov_4.072310_1_plen_153_part_10